MNSFRGLDSSHCVALLSSLALCSSEGLKLLQDLAVSRLSEGEKEELHGKAFALSKWKLHLLLVLTFCCHVAVLFCKRGCLPGAQPGLSGAGHSVTLRRRAEWKAGHVGNLCRRENVRREFREN